MKTCNYFNYDTLRRACSNDVACYIGMPEGFQCATISDEGVVHVLIGPDSISAEYNRSIAYRLERIR